MTRRLAILLLVLSPALAWGQPTPAPSTREDDSKPPLFWSMDRMLERLGKARADEIAPDLKRGRAVTVASPSNGMNVDAAAEIIEILGNDRFRVRTEGKEKVLSGKDLRRLNLPYVLPNGTRVLAGGSRMSGPIMKVDLQNDPELRAFLEKAKVIGDKPINDMEKLKKLTSLVNESLKYPSNSTPYNELDSRNTGREVRFGEYLKIHEGVCRHMALAMKLAMDKIGIRSRYVAGEALASGTGAVRGGHAWVEALTTEGKRLLVDPTWHDAGLPLETAYGKGKLRRPKPDARRIIPPGKDVITDGSSLVADMLDRYRRQDGTVDWKKMTKQRVGHEAGGLAQFGMALFLKELAVVARTGDRLRIEEFFDGLTSIGFYKSYGLFVVGARTAEIAYSRYLERFVRPRFVNGILKTNLVLATGLALPQIVSGNFSGKAFVISLSSLGLSSTAVKAGIHGIKWVTSLDARAATSLRRMIPAAGRVAKVGGWVYAAAELAVVLYFADEIEEAIHARLERRDATRALGQAGQRFLAAVRRADATPESIAQAAAEYSTAWTAYRAFLNRPMHEADARLAMRLAKSARDAKLAADKRAGVVDRVRKYPALLKRIEAKHGSLEAYAAALVREDEAKIARKVDTLFKAHARERKERMREIYEGQRRDDSLLGDVGHLEWLASGAPAAGDPWGGRSDLFARYGRSRARAGLHGALANPSPNRLQSYEDEAEVLALASRVLANKPEHQEAVRVARKRVLQTRDLDRRLSATPSVEGHSGAVGALKSAPNR